MIFGMSIAAFTQLHVIISLIAILNKEPPFAVAQAIVLILLVGLGIAAFKKFRPLAQVAATA